MCDQNMITLTLRGNCNFFCRGKRTDICVGDASGSRVQAACEAHTGGTNHGMDNFIISFVDDPQTTSALTYQIFMRVTGSTHYINRTNPDDNASYQSRCPSTITAMEVSA